MKKLILCVGLGLFLLFILPLPLYIFNLVNIDLPVFVEEYYKSLSGLLQTFVSFVVFTLFYEGIKASKKTSTYNSVVKKINELKSAIHSDLTADQSIVRNTALVNNIYSFLFLINGAKDNFMDEIDDHKLFVFFSNFDEMMKSKFIEIIKYIDSNQNAKSPDEIRTIVQYVVDYLESGTS